MNYSTTCACLDALGFGLDALFRRREYMMMIVVAKLVVENTARRSGEDHTPKMWASPAPSGEDHMP
jgi:hypothetical protein